MHLSKQIMSSMYWQSQNIHSPDIFKTQHTFITQGFNMKWFAKIVKSYNYFSRALYFASLTGFRIHPSLYKYSLTSRVTSSYALYKIYSEPCLWLQTQTYSSIFASYSKIFRHIVAYLEPCVALVYSERCCI